MIFRQLFEPLSCTYTYLFGCEASGQAVLIDPTLPTWERNAALLKDLGLKLAYTLDTHIHADHITAALQLGKRGTRQPHRQRRAGRPVVLDFAVEEGCLLEVGSLTFTPLHTPGHTDGHFAYVIGERVLTGDALLIDGCGRTDFQNGDATTLYRSVHDKLFTLPDDTLVYPAHDYKGRRVSTIAQEKQRNPRLGNERSLAEFVEIMSNLNLAYPKFIDYAVPGNRQCGVCPTNLPDQLQAYCNRMTESLQG